MSDLFREKQTSAWKYLNYELARNKPSKLRWCCWPKDRSAAARLAQVMLTSPDVFDRSSTEVEKYESKRTGRGEERPLPSCDRPQGWRELSQWKHPKLDLNLLQVAIVCGHQSGVMYLWQECFKKKEEYLGASSVLVNHPWHLILALRTGYKEKLPMGEVDVEVFLQEGRVDLQADLLRKWSNTRSLVEPETNIPMSGSKVGLDWIQDGRGDLYKQMFSVISSKLFRGQAEQSTVKCLRKLVWDNRFHCEEKDRCLLDTANAALNRVAVSTGEWRQLVTELAEEFLILLCQVSFWDIWKNSYKDLSLLMCDALKSGLPLMKAASFMYPSILRQAIEHMVGDQQVNANPEFQSLFKDVEARTLRVRSLQNLCMLAVLRRVNGDARKVWDETDLSQRLKSEYFHVPFQALYDRIGPDS